MTVEECSPSNFRFSVDVLDCRKTDLLLSYVLTGKKFSRPPAEKFIAIKEDETWGAGKAHTALLTDGESRGRIKCTLAAWTGVAFKIPRTALDQCEDRDELKQSGEYFLLGMSDETGRSAVYIGQAGARKNGEGILSRLQEHRRDPEKDYWTEAAVFTASDNSPGATELSSLEHRFCTMAPEAKRYDVKNGNDPNFGSTTEEKMCAMEEFVENARVMMETLGHKLFEPLTHWTVQTTQPADGEVAAERRLYLKRTVSNVGTMEGEGAQSAEGFVVLRGALCRRWGAPNSGIRKGAARRGAAERKELFA